MPATSCTVRDHRIFKEFVDRSIIFNELTLRVDGNIVIYWTRDEFQTAGVVRLLEGFNLLGHYVIYTIRSAAMSTVGNICNDEFIRLESARRCSCPPSRFRSRGAVSPNSRSHRHFDGFTDRLPATGHRGRRVARSFKRGGRPVTTNLPLRTATSARGGPGWACPLFLQGMFLGLMQKFKSTVNAT